MLSKNLLVARFLCRHVSSSSLNKVEPSFPKRIFSGIQPTGAIHLGNYLGAVAQWVKFQNENQDMILSVVDLHSMTLPHDPKQLSKYILETTATLLGCGIDPEKVILFQQSAVPEHTQLSWCLGCICTMPRLAHLPQYKEKSKDLKDVPLGLFVYPVLQAADILAYKATHVPVGDDQVQQIQLAQELAKMFNTRFGNTFPIPHTIVTGTVHARLKSLREPSKKMSKSDPDPKSRISLMDKPDDIVRNIKKAVTDCISEVTYDEKERPGVSNLISIHSFITNQTIDDICAQTKDINTGQYKLLVADMLVQYLQPIQENISKLLADPHYLLDILHQGNQKASVIASTTWNEVQQKLGIVFKIEDKSKLKAQR